MELAAAVVVGWLAEWQDGNYRRSYRRMERKLDLQESKTRLADDGVAIIPGVFSRQETDRMRGAAITALSANNTRYPHPPLQRRGEFPALLFWPAVVSSVLDLARRDPRMVEIVRSFLGDDVKQINNQVYYRMPGDGDSFCWHQDVCFRPESQFTADIDDAYLQTIIAIDPVGPENAAVEFIPGSHKQGRMDRFANVGGMLREFDRLGLQGIKYEAKPGDVMVWSVLTVHGSEENCGDRMRMTYMNGFARSNAVKSGVGYPDYLVGGRVIDGLDLSRFP